MFNLPTTMLRQSVVTFTPIFEYPSIVTLERAKPQATFLRANVAPAAEGFMCEVSLVNRRNYLDPFEGYKVYLPNSNDEVVRLRPAFGETRRNPQKFVAVVLIDGNPKRSRPLAINAGQMLRVI